MDLTTAISAASASVRLASAAFDCHARATRPITNAVPLPPAIVRGESATGGAVRAGETVRSADGRSAGAHRRASALLRATRSASERICCRFGVVARNTAAQRRSRRSRLELYFRRKFAHPRLHFALYLKMDAKGERAQERALTSSRHTHPPPHTQQNYLPSSSSSRGSVALALKVKAQPRPRSRRPYRLSLLSMACELPKGSRSSARCSGESATPAAAPAVTGDLPGDLPGAGATSV